MSASTPVSPTTAAMAPKAPIGATHMIIESTRKTRRCRCPMPRRIGSPERPIACSAKPTSSATSSVWSTMPEVSEENIDVGMMPSRKSVVLPWPSAAWAAPAAEVSGVIWRPSPGCRMLPTARPMASANVDMMMK